MAAIDAATGFEGCLLHRQFDQGGGFPRFQMALILAAIFHGATLQTLDATTSRSRKPSPRATASRSVSVIPNGIYEKPHERSE